MTIDDIFFPAVEGNLLMLETRLRAREVDLNQMLDAGVNNGFRTQLPLLFSVLNKMSTNGINTQVLEKLIRYGADPNGYVILETDSETMKIPLLTYALCDWDNPELAEFLLTHGADPNAVKEIRHQSGHTSTYPMLYFTLINQGPNSNTLLEMMLKHGADPNEYVNLYIAFGRYYQYLPPIYFALVEQQDRQKCVILFRYGASPQVTIEVGHGFAHKTNFQRYIQLVHPNLSDVLVSCFEASQLHPQAQTQAAPPVPTRTAPSGSQATLQDQQRIQGRPSNPVPRTTSLQRCYGRLVAYLFANFGIMAIGLMIFAPLIYIDDLALAGAFFAFGLPCAAICALIWLMVSRKAKARGQVNVMGQFVLDSLMIFAKVLLMTTVILIPVALAIGSNIQWEQRTTSSGRSVYVKKNADGSFEDGHGNRYTERD